MSAQLARTAFTYPLQTPSWFAGHMAKSLNQLPALLEEVDLVLEARDARLPLTSVNPAFDSVLEHIWGHAGAGPDRRGKGKEKLVVYTKRDLAEQRYEQVSHLLPSLSQHICLCQRIAASLGCLADISHSAAPSRTSPANVFSSPTRQWTTTSALC